MIESILWVFLYICYVEIRGGLDDESECGRVYEIVVDFEVEDIIIVVKGMVGVVGFVE